MPHNPNPTERAARAEALAERLAYVLENLVDAAHDVVDGGDLRALFPVGKENPRKALDAWEAHKADYATLDQAEQERRAVLIGVGRSIAPDYTDDPNTMLHLGGCDCPRCTSMQEPRP